MEEMGRRLSLNEAMFYWVQILDAVDYLHNLPVPVIHKDIKGKQKGFDVESHLKCACHILTQLCKSLWKEVSQERIWPFMNMPWLMEVMMNCALEGQGLFIYWVVVTQYTIYSLTPKCIHCITVTLHYKKLYGVPNQYVKRWRIKYRCIL